MKVQISTISNGLRVITAEMPNTIRATAQILVGTGSRHEKDFEPGIAHFLEHARFKTTSNRTTREINKEIEILGANFNAYTDKDHTVYYATGLASSVSKIIEILGDITLNSIFPDSEIETERNVVLQEIAMYADRIDDLSDNAFYDAAYSGHPLSLPILGTSEFISKVNRNDLIRFVDEHYFAQNMVLSVAGNIKHEDVLVLAEKYFSKLKTSGVRDIKGDAIFQQNQKIITGDFEQLSLNIGFKLTKPRDKHWRMAGNLASLAISGGMCSPLFHEVREKRGLVYSTYSYLLTSQEDNNIIFGAGTTPDNYKELIETLGYVIKNANELISADDITRAKNQSLVSFSSAAENSAGVASVYGRGLLLEKEIETQKDTINRVNNMPEDDIRGILSSLKDCPVAIGAGGSISDKLDIMTDLKAVL